MGQIREKGKKNGGGEGTNLREMEKREQGQENYN